MISRAAPLAALLAVALLLPAAPPPAAAQSPAAAPITIVDGFDGPPLSGVWSWLREDPARWSLSARPGFLRITAQTGGLLFAGNDAKNLLLRPMPPGPFEIQTRLSFAPTENFQFAGLLVYLDDDNFLTLVRSYCAPSESCVGQQVSFDLEQAGAVAAENYATAAPAGDIYLRVVRAGARYEGFISADGQAWSSLGSHTVGFAPTRVGLASGDGGLGAPEIPADFDSFTLVDSSERIFVPLLAQ